MNTKHLMGVAAGLLLLAGSGAALADGGRDRGGHGGGHGGGHEWNDRGHRGFDDRGGHDRSRHEGWYHPAPRAYHHHHPHWGAPRAYYPPPHHHRGGWGPRYGYDDGITIIFKGRID